MNLLPVPPNVYAVPGSGELINSPETEAPIALKLKKTNSERSNLVAVGEEFGIVMVASSVAVVDVTVVGDAETEILMVGVMVCVTTLCD